MKTVQIEGKQVADFDAVLIAKLKLTSATAKVVKNERMLLGVRNEQKEIYRQIGVTGLDKFIGVIADLIKLGFIDELEDQEDPMDGYDAIFRKG